MPSKKQTSKTVADFQDDHALLALHARRRIERAVDNGRLPVWVMDACEAWERAALAYGASMARRELSGAATGALAGTVALH